MARGSEILLISNPKGNFDEGIIGDTSKPGQLMEITPAIALVNGRLTFRARSQTAGAVGPVCVLLGDYLQGKLSVGATTPVITSGGVTIPAQQGAAGDAYVAGTRGFLYWPIPGDEFNIVLGDVAGTGDIVTVGDLFGINNNGKIIADSSYNDASFLAMETMTALTADTLLFVKYLGRRVG